MTNYLCVRNYWGPDDHYYQEGETYALPSNPSTECFTTGTRPIPSDPVYRGGGILTMLPDSALDYVR